MGVILLLSKSPSGRWLGFLSIAYLTVLIFQFSSTTYLAPASLTLISITFFLYVRAFFYQKNRTSLAHYIFMMVPFGVGILLSELSLVVGLISGLLIVVYTILTIRLLLNEQNLPESRLTDSMAKKLCVSECYIHHSISLAIAIGDTGDYLFGVHFLYPVSVI